ncbi:MAG: protease family protein [Gaiellaceae bacterium]|nr:protease family protein [Gaiellaceae bacterium]
MLTTRPAPTPDVTHAGVHRPGAINLAALALFAAIAYAVSWSWTFPLAIRGDVIMKGQGWPTDLPALAGPACAALLVTAWIAGRAGTSELWSRITRWRMPVRWWAATLSPLAFLAVALGIAAAAGKLPHAADFGRYSGLPLIGVGGVVFLAVVGGLGEETGWRGFALPTLQRRYGALVAALMITPLWALWHLPFFLTVDGFRHASPVAAVGFVFAIGCGSIVLTWLYNGTRGSILACAIWHGLYNVTTATVAASGLIAGVTTTFVVVLAIALVGLELRARHLGTPSVLGPPPANEASRANDGLQLTVSVR